MKKKDNCFLVQLKPFAPDERTNKKVVELQKDSIDNRICGMGWADELFEKNPECKISDIEKKSGDKSFSEAWNRYSEIIEGNYILTRLFETSMCYIGKVKSKAYHSNKKVKNVRYGNNYSWIVDIEEWKQIGTFINIPGALRGLMQGRMKTIKSLQDDKFKIQRKIIKNLYEGIGEKIDLDRENFCFALDALDLEDLVAKYIITYNPEYTLIPSSCKSNEQTLEFKFINKNKKITCQVKNNEPIDIDIYNKISKEFEKIYLFSANGYTGKIEANNIKKINQGELFNVLKNDFDNQGQFYNELNKYYNIKNEEIL